MQTIYLVMWRDYEEDGVVSAHATREGAEKRLSECERGEHGSHSKYGTDLDYSIITRTIEE